MSEEVQQEEASVAEEVPSDFEAKLQERVSQELKQIKEKLDKAYSARDEALKKLAIIDNEKREAEKKRLEEEGKHKELYEMQLHEERAKAQSLEKKVVELTRDISVRDALAPLTFKNEKAFTLAFSDIVSQLVQKNGDWVAKDGRSIGDFIKAFSEDESNSFLFKPKTSAGTGSTPAKGAPVNKSLFEMTQDEVLQAAAQGRLRR
jgi:flagellar biosynthesis GTPase FlhF